MLTLITPKVYAFIAVVTSGILYGIDWLDRNEAFVGFLERQITRAATSGLGPSIGKLIIKPMIFAIDGPAGAITAGLLWPLALLWLLLFVLMLMFSIMAPAIGKATCGFSSNC